MRLAAALALLIAGCATTPEAPAERVAGCWIQRDSWGAVTMRWLPDAGRPGALRGELLTYRSGEPTRASYSLESSEIGASLCQLGDDGAATRCWQVAEGEGGSLEDGRAFIDRYGGRLRITIIGDGPDRVIFSGARDGCD